MYVQSCFAYEAFFGRSRKVFHLAPFLKVRISGTVENGLMEVIQLHVSTIWTILLLCQQEHHFHQLNLSLTFSCTATLVFKGLSGFNSVCFFSAGMVTVNGGLSLPKRSKTDCFFITFALLTAKQKCHKVKPKPGGGESYSTKFYMGRLLTLYITFFN